VLGLIARAAFLTPLGAGLTVGALLGQLAYDNLDAIKRAFGFTGAEAGREFSSQILANVSLEEFQRNLENATTGPLILANESMEEFRARANAAAAEVKRIVDEQDAANRGIIERLGDAFGSMWETVKRLGAEAWSGFANAANEAWQSVQQTFRTGWDRQHRNAPTIARIAEACGIQAIAIHGRTRADGYSGDAEYATIAEVKATARIPVIANGDITSAAKAQQVLAQTCADGIIIG
jgi:hypothetical protein